MNKMIKLLNLLILLSLLLNCDVTFNEDLEEYIENIAARSPLDFTLTDSVVIDENDAINMGFTLEDLFVSYTLTNSESMDINLAAYEGLTGDFIIDAYDAFTLTEGESFTFDVTFDYSTDNYNSRVSQEVNFEDEDGRTYTFYLWATTRTQPLTVYSEDGVELDLYDLGNWDDYREHTVILKNEGLEAINVTSITPPANINLNSDSYISMEINDEVSVLLQYDYSSGSVINAEDIVFTSDYSYDISGGLSLDLYAGGSLDFEFKDSSDTVVASPINIGTYTSGDPITETYTVTNNSIFDLDLTISMDSSDYFTSTLVSSQTIDASGTYSFDLSFQPSGDYGTETIYIYFYDNNTGRSFTLEVNGTYSIT